jgi:hypothetical protein
MDALLLLELGQTFFNLMRIIIVTPTILIIVIQMMQMIVIDIFAFDYNDDGYPRQVIVTGSFDGESE